MKRKSSRRLDLTFFISARTRSLQKKGKKPDFDRLTDQRQDSFFLPYIQQNDYNYIHHLVRAKSSRLLFLNWRKIWVLITISNSWSIVTYVEFSIVIVRTFGNENLYFFMKTRVVTMLHFWKTSSNTSWEARVAHAVSVFSVTTCTFLVSPWFYKCIHWLFMLINVKLSQSFQV